MKLKSEGRDVKMVQFADKKTGWLHGRSNPEGNLFQIVNLMGNPGLFFD